MKNSFKLIVRISFAILLILGLSSFYLLSHKLNRIDHGKKNAGEKGKTNDFIKYVEFDEINREVLKIAADPVSNTFFKLIPVTKDKTQK